MEWVERMNRTLDYLEANLCGPIDPGEIARLMACPYTVFQRMFGPLTGIPLSEYLRRRRLSRAAEELRHTRLRVLDIALRYGYDSADAFAAAFRRMHGISPQEARRPEARLTFYPRLTFTLTITGGSEMEYRFWERAPFQVMGVRRVTPVGGGTWAIVKSDGSAAAIASLCGHACDLGLCFGFDPEGNNDYLCGVEWQGEPVSGFDAYACPAACWLVFTAEGSIAGGVLGQTWKRIYGEFMPHSSYRQLDLPTIEKYLLWDEAADTCHVEILIPVEKGPDQPLAAE